MAVLLALLAALSWGSGDYLGGKASGRMHPVTVTASAQIVGLVGLLVATPLIGTEFSWRDAVWPGLGGAAGALGLLLLYGALAQGRVSVVAPITGLVSAGGPTLWGAAAGERVGAWVVLGLTVGVVAIVAMSMEAPNSDASWSIGRSIVVAVLSGVGFALFIVALDTAHDDAGVAPVLAARVVSVPLLLLLAGRLQVPRIASSQRLTVAAAGVLDTAANAMLVLALARGQLIVVTVLSSLYPAQTVLLARWFDGERLRRVQQIGLALAAIAVVCITAG